MTSRRLVALASGLLAGCVQTPMGPQVPFDYTHLGLPLAPSETVAIAVSTELSARDLQERQQQVSSVPSPPSVLESIGAGLRALPSDVRLVAADDVLRRACFDTGRRSVRRDWADAVIAIPDWSGEDCRALIARRGIRYFVSVAGYRWTAEPKGWGESTALGVETVRVYSLTAQVFDAISGALVCEAAEHERAASSVGVALFYIPIPLLTVVDESAYWKRVAWDVGNKLRSCFLQPPSAGSGP